MHARNPVVFAFLLAIAGCSTWPFGAFHEDDARPVRHVIEGEAWDGVVELTPRDLSEPGAAEAPDPEYRVGPYDMIHVDVQRLAVTAEGAVPMGTPPGAGVTRVDGAGFVQLPFVGRLLVAGKTLAEIRDELTGAYGKIARDPDVVVELVGARSKQLFLVGQFRKPGVVSIERPMNVLSTLAAAEGLTNDADLRGARVLRDGKLLPIDLYRLLEDGDFSQNVWLKPGDTIYVPDESEQVVFVVGDVGAPGMVRMINGHMTLNQALAAASANRQSGNDWEYVRIIRSQSPTRGELIVVDYLAMLEGRALPFPLRAGDVIYVPRSGWGNWNDALNEILPSLQTVGAILNPFVSLLVIRDLARQG
ncbi:MAG: polysaccharide biosynthesis/export family protein [Planctomycetota bacterium]